MTRPGAPKRNVTLNVSKARQQRNSATQRDPHNVHFDMLWQNMVLDSSDVVWYLHVSNGLMRMSAKAVNALGERRALMKTHPRDD
eukprot:2513708-Amphidinium_carterae.2